MSNKVAVGIDIGGTNTVYGFIDNSGKVIEYVEIPTRGNKPINNLLNRLDLRIKQFFKKNNSFELLGVGIGAPNGNHFTGKIQSPPNLSWGDIDIVNILFITLYELLIKMKWIFYEFFSLTMILYLSIKKYNGNRC